MQNLGRAVDVISDFSQSGVLPDGMMSGFRRSMLTAPLDFGVAVIVSKSDLLLRLLTVYIRLNRQIGAKLLITSSVEEARVLLLKRQPQA